MIIDISHLPSPNQSTLIQLFQAIYLLGVLPNYIDDYKFRHRQGESCYLAAIYCHDTLLDQYWRSQQWQSPK